MGSDTAAVSASVSIPRRVNRPLASGNGGYCPRALPNFFDGEAGISPRRPVPFDSPLDVVRHADGAVRGLNGEALVAVARSAPEPFSARTADTLALTDGTLLRLRPINADDRDGLAALFGRLSAESRRRRYLGPKTEMTPRELASLTDVDHVCDEASVAVDERDGSIIGVARYAHSADQAGVAEVAAEVADDVQGLGIGTELARRHRAARPRERIDHPHRHDPVGEPAGSRALARPRVPDSREPRQRNRAGVGALPSGKASSVAAYDAAGNRSAKRINFTIR